MRIALIGFGDVRCNALKDAYLYHAPLGDHTIIAQKDDDCATSVARANGCEEHSVSTFGQSWQAEMLHPADMAIVVWDGEVGDSHRESTHRKEQSETALENSDARTFITRAAHKGVTLVATVSD